MTAVPSPPPTVLTDEKVSHNPCLSKKPRHSVHYRGEEYVYLLVISLNQNDQNSEVRISTKILDIVFIKKMLTKHTEPNIYQRGSDSNNQQLSVRRLHLE